MVLVSKWLFFQLFFSSNIRQEHLFYDILQRENAFLGYKNKKSKNSKNLHFCRGVNPWFWSKNGLFSNFFFRNIGERNFFYDILERKYAFVCYIKTKSSISRKIDIFPKGLTHGFGPKMAIFPTFFFRQYRPAECLLRYSRTKQRLSRL